MYRIGFIIEQALGHITHGQNLRRFVDQDPSVEAQWGLPTRHSAGLARRLQDYRSNWSLQASLQARRMLGAMQRQSPPQALFFHTQITATLAPDWLGRIPSIVSLDATPRQYDRLGDAYNHAAGPDWLERGKWWLSRRCFGLARHLVTWSEWTRQGLVHEYDVLPEKITVVPPGVDTLAFLPSKRRVDAAEPVRILFVGADFERKGGRILLEGFRRLRQSVAVGPTLVEPAPNVELHVVTRAGLPPEPGVVVHTGLHPNDARLRQLYGECDIFCLPTLADCLPMVLMEAGAAGLPLISTQLAAIPEIVQDGCTGLLVPRGDPVVLAQALGCLIADAPLRRALGSGAQQLVRRQFDAQANSQRLVALIKHVVDQDQSRQKP